MVDKIASRLISGDEIALNIAFEPYPEEGIVVARCLDIPGCVSEGQTLAEAKANIADAIDACLSVILEDAISSRIGKTFSSEPVATEKIRVTPPHVLRGACAG